MESPSAALVRLVGESKSWSNYYLQVAIKLLLASCNACEEKCIETGAPLRV